MENPDPHTLHAALGHQGALRAAVRFLYCSTQRSAEDQGIRHEKAGLEAWKEEPEGLRGWSQSGGRNLQWLLG